MKLHRRSNSTIAIFAVAMLVAVIVGTRVSTAQSSGQEPQLAVVLSGGWPTRAPRLPEFVLYRDRTVLYLDNDLGILMRTRLGDAEHRALLDDAGRVLIPDRDCPGSVVVDGVEPTIYWNDGGQAHVSGVRGNAYDNAPGCREFWEFGWRLRSFGEGLGTAWSAEPIELTLWTNPAARATNREPIQWPADWPGLSQALPVEGRKNQLRLVLPNSPEMLSALKSLVSEADRARRPILIDGRADAILRIAIAPNEDLPGQEIWEGAIDSVGKAK